MLKIMSNALTNVGKHLKSNVACARNPWYSNDYITSIFAIFVVKKAGTMHFNLVFIHNGKI